MMHLFFVAALAAVADQGIDLSILDRLADKAKEANTVTLDGATLKLASRFLSGDDPDEQKVKNLVAGLKSISVRNFEFKEKGQYTDADLNPIRMQLRQPGWSKIVESKSEEDKEHTEVYLHSENDKIIGIAILSAEPRELTVVAISGPINLEDLDKLGGNLGIPHLPDHGKRPPRPLTPKPPPKPESKPE
jgi:hypothetical protein